MMKRLAAAVILPLALLVATGPQTAALQAPAPVPVATIPFDLAVRHIMLKITVNKSQPLSFVFDTGANEAIVRSDTATALGLSLHGSVSGGGAGAGRQAGHRVRDARWSLVGLEDFSQPVVLSLPFATLPAGLGQDVDGIVGAQFIKEFVVELDYQARVMRLHDRKKFTYAGQGTTLPLDFNSHHHPVLKATVTPVGGKPIEHQFVLDVGSGAALILHSPFVAEHRLIDPAKTIRTIGMAGAGGQSFGRTGRVASLQIGPYSLNDLPATFSQDQAGALADPTLAGNIGAAVASRFRVFLDYGRKRIILEPSPTFANPFEGPNTGLAIRAFGDDYRTFRVIDVLEDSPATGAGIREGDVITAVDDMPAEKFTLTSLLETLSASGSRRLTIRRGDERVTVTLTPRRLI